MLTKGTKTKTTQGKSASGDKSRSIKKPKPLAHFKAAAKLRKPKVVKAKKMVSKPAAEIKPKAPVSPAPQTAQVLERPKRQEIPAPPVTVTPAKEELRPEPLSEVILVQESIKHFAIPLRKSPKVMRRLPAGRQIDYVNGRKTDTDKSFKSVV